LVKYWPLNAYCVLHTCMQAQVLHRVQNCALPDPKYLLLNPNPNPNPTRFLDLNPNPNPNPNPRTLKKP